MEEIWTDFFTNDKFTIQYSNLGNCRKVESIKPDGYKIKSRDVIKYRVILDKKAHYIYLNKVGEDYQFGKGEAIKIIRYKNVAAKPREIAPKYVDYTPKEKEIFKPIEQHDLAIQYEISNLGSCREKESGLFLNKMFRVREQTYYYTLKHSQRKSTDASIHKLVANAFIPKRMVWSNGNIDGVRHGMTRKLQSAVVFIDGDPRNHKLENLKYSNEHYPKSNKKRRFKFNTGKELLDEIRSNMNDENESDIKVIIQFLYGDQKIIWDLFLKYDKNYKRMLVSFLQKNKQDKRTRMKIKESHLGLSDFITEACIKMIGKIKKGRFTGDRPFVGWSCIVVRNYLAMYIRKKNEALLQDRTAQHFSYNN